MPIITQEEIDDLLATAPYEGVPVHLVELLDTVNDLVLYINDCNDVKEIIDELTRTKEIVDKAFRIIEELKESHPEEFI